MTENPLPAHQPGFYWREIASSTPAEKQIPPFADPELIELMRISQQHTTRKARISIQRGRDAVIDFKHAMLGTEHLLLGVLRTPDQLVAGMLKRHGFDRIQLSRTFEAEFVPGAEPKPEAIPMTAACKQAVRLAIQEATRQSQPVGPEHLLLGISNEGSGLAGAFLARLRLTHQGLLLSLSLEANKREADEKYREE